MNERDFLDWCKDEICKYTNKHLDITDNKKISKNYDELKEYDFEKMEKKTVFKLCLVI